MAFQTPATVKEIIEGIAAKKYLLPAIQREFVWNVDQIEALFDSLLSGYPIGSFLFWQVRGENRQQYQFYEFIRNYHELSKRHNEKASLSGAEELTAILDGQQRLTALFIGLKGTYAYRARYGRKQEVSSYPVRRLYLSLLAQASPEQSKIYDFRFLTEDESRDSTGHHWFPVGHVLDFAGPKDVQLYLARERISDSEFAINALWELHRAVTDSRLINYYLEKDQDLEKVLQIFIRVNSGGTQLSYSDLLLSTATAQWRTLDARETITALVDELNGPEQRFDFSKDVVMKACLVLADIPDIRFRVTNFNATNMKLIEERWRSIADALRLTVSLISTFGFNSFTLTSANAVIPIAYYLMKCGLPAGFVQSKTFAADRAAIRQWLFTSLLRGAFGAHGDTVLSQMRSAIKASSNGFPSDDLSGNFKQFTSNDVNDLLLFKYGQKQTFAILSLLYPGLDVRYAFHQDHVHPKASFTKRKLMEMGVPGDQINFFLEHVDCVPNLQLLESVPNQEKSDMDFLAWLNETHPTQEAQSDYRRRHMIPELDLGLTNFIEFFKGRSALMAAKLTRFLGINSTLPSEREFKANEQSRKNDSQKNAGATADDAQIAGIQTDEENGEYDESADDSYLGQWDDAFGRSEFAQIVGAEKILIWDRLVSLVRNFDETFEETFRGGYAEFRKGTRPLGFVTCFPAKTFLRVRIRLRDRETYVHLAHTMTVPLERDPTFKNALVVRLKNLDDFEQNRETLNTLIGASFHDYCAERT